MASDHRRLSGLAVILAAGTMLSRVLGLVRDIAWAALPTGSRDAFIVAFRLPNMLRDVVGEGALNAAFVPTLSDTQEQGGGEEFRKAVSALMSAMLLLLAGLTLVGLVLAPALLQGLNTLQPITQGQERSPEELALLVSLGRWTFPYLFFIGMAVFAMGALFTAGHYATPSWSPALLNVAFIIAVVWFRDWFEEPAYALVVGVWLGGIAQFAAMYIALGKKTGVWLPRFNLGHPSVRAVFWLLGPVVIGQAAGEANKLVDNLFAYMCEDGTVSALYYANRLIQLPMSIFGYATAAAVLPAASAAASRGDMDDVRATVVYGLRQTAFLVVPALLGLVAMGAPIIHLLFERQSGFGPEDTHRTATALSIYAAGLLSFAGVKVAVAGFYAVKDTRTPVLVASGAMLLNIVLNCALVGPFGYRGLAWATTISFTLNLAGLLSLLQHRFGALYDRDLMSGLVRIASAAAASAALAYVLYLRMGAWFGEDTLTAQLTYTGVPIAAAAAAYVLLCWILHVPELSRFASLLRRKAG